MLLGNSTKALQRKGPDICLVVGCQKHAAPAVLCDFTVLYAIVLDTLLESFRVCCEMLTCSSNEKQHAPRDCLRTQSLAAASMYHGTGKLQLARDGGSMVMVAWAAFVRA